MAFIDDIKDAWKTGKSLKEIKEARDYFADKEDLAAFFKSGWTIDDVKEFKEMVETKPEIQETKQETKKEVKNESGLEVETKPTNPTENFFKQLGERGGI